MSARVCHQAGVCRITQEIRPISAVVRHGPLGQGPHPAVLVPVTAAVRLATVARILLAAVYNMATLMRILATVTLILMTASVKSVTAIINNCCGNAHSGYGEGRSNNGNGHSGRNEYRRGWNEGYRHVPNGRRCWNMGCRHVPDGRR